MKSSARLHLPKMCLQCDADGTIALQTVVHGTAVELAWVCQACGRETPINLGIMRPSERRVGAHDRRRVTRQDRRRPSQFS